MMSIEIKTLDRQIGFVDIHADLSTGETCQLLLVHTSFSYKFADNLWKQLWEHYRAIVQLAGEVPAIHCEPVISYKPDGEIYYHLLHMVWPGDDRKDRLATAQIMVGPELKELTDPGSPGLVAQVDVYDADGLVVFSCDQEGVINFP